MPTFRCQRSQRLDSFLQQNGYQRYRISILLQCRAVFLIRQGKRSMLIAPDTRLRAGDDVLIKDPLPPACQNALYNIPPAEFRDYAWAPGPTPYDQRMREVLQRRPQTILINNALYSNLVKFIEALQSSPQITNPIRDILIVSHSNREGILEIPLDNNIVRQIEYEHLEELCAEGTINISPDIFEPRPRDEAGPGLPIPAVVHVKGCCIGEDNTRPFLQKLKEALGDRLQVTAPKYLHHAATHPAGGRVEYMAYSFKINRPKPLKTQTQAIRAFIGKRFPRYNDTPVPPRNWKDWIPQRIPRGDLPQEIPLKAWVRDPVRQNGRMPMNASFYYSPRWFHGAVPADVDPGSRRSRKQAVRQQLVDDDPHGRYRDDHLFPMYVRRGYKSMDEFMDGWTWEFRWNSQEKILYYTATRYEYTVEQPIVHPPTRRLIMNFYPDKDKNHARRLIMFRDGDGLFFATVR